MESNCDTESFRCNASFSCEGFVDEGCDTTVVILCDFKIIKPPVFNLSYFVFSSTYVLSVPAEL